MTGITIMSTNALTACVIDIRMDTFRASITLLVIQSSVLMLGDFSISLQDFQALCLQKKSFLRRKGIHSLLHSISLSSLSSQNLKRHFFNFYSKMNLLRPCVPSLPSHHLPVECPDDETTKTSVCKRLPAGFYKSSENEMEIMLI